MRGCTYQLAPNFDSIATADDGSCVFGVFGGSGGISGGAIVAIVLLAVVLPWVLLCGAWRRGYLDKFIHKRRGRVQVGGNEAYEGSGTAQVGAGSELPLSSQQMGSELPYLPPVGSELPSLSRLAEAEAVVIGQAEAGDLPFAQALPDERATAPLVLSTAPSPSLPREADRHTCQGCVTRRRARGGLQGHARYFRAPIAQCGRPTLDVDQCA